MVRAFSPKPSLRFGERSGWSSPMYSLPSFSLRRSYSTSSARISIILKPQGIKEEKGRGEGPSSRAVILEVYNPSGINEILIFAKSLSLYPNLFCNRFLVSYHNSRYHQIHATNIEIAAG